MTDYFLITSLFFYSFSLPSCLHNPHKPFVLIDMTSDSGYDKDRYVPLEVESVCNGAPSNPVYVTSPMDSPRKTALSIHMIPNDPTHFIYSVRSPIDGSVLVSKRGTNLIASMTFYDALGYVIDHDDSLPDATLDLKAKTTVYIDFVLAPGSSKHSNGPYELLTLQFEVVPQVLDFFESGLVEAKPHLSTITAKWDSFGQVQFTFNKTKLIKGSRSGLWLAYTGLARLAGNWSCVSSDESVFTSIRNQPFARGVGFRFEFEPLRDVDAFEGTVSITVGGVGSLQAMNCLPVSERKSAERAADEPSTFQMETTEPHESLKSTLDLVTKPINIVKKKRKPNTPVESEASGEDELIEH
jgi:hypothetical protein